MINFADMIVLAMILAAVTAAVIHKRRMGRSGGCGCQSGCAGCAGCGGRAVCGQNPLVKGD